MGYLPEDHRFPEYHSAFSLLHFYGQLLSVPHRELQTMVPEMLELVGLKDRMHYKIRTYSKGMKQRVGIAQALLHKPEIIFFDEPTDGVDPVGRREIRVIMQRLRDNGTTIFLNSHLLGEVEMICDRVAILRRGEVIREGDIPSLTEQKGRYLIGLAPDQQFPVDEVRQQGYAVEKFLDRHEVTLLGDHQSIDPIVDLLRSRGLSIRHLVEKRQTLEDLFIQAVDEALPVPSGPSYHMKRGH